MRLLIFDHCEYCDGSVRSLKLSVYIRPRFLSRADGNRGAGGYLPPPLIGQIQKPYYNQGEHIHPVYYCTPNISDLPLALLSTIALDDAEALVSPYFWWIYYKVCALPGLSINLSDVLNKRTCTLIVFKKKILPTHYFYLLT